MDIELAKEIIDCLPNNRTLYWYYKDAYALSLLRRHLQSLGPQRVNVLKASKFGKLLHKSMFQSTLANLGKGMLDVADLDSIYQSDQECYVLTLGIWGDNRAYAWQQVSRQGANLVLQLNFNNQHNESYKTKVLPDLDVFQYGGHPVSDTRCTMAWARIDLDLDKDEVLIEEIQTDWLRGINYLRRLCEKASSKGEACFAFEGHKLYVNKVKIYLENIEKHKSIWSEAVLNAVLNFIIDELGVRNIFYHGYETGAILKSIRRRKPPKSLYTELPKKFCFDKVTRGPEFINQDKRARRRLKAIKQPHWFSMTA